MADMRCPEARRWISCAIDGEALPAGSRERLESHLEACGGCRSERAHWQRQAAELRDALRPAPAEREQLESFAARAASLARLETGAASSRPRRGIRPGIRPGVWPGRVAWGAVGAAAAALCVAWALLLRMPVAGGPEDGSGSVTARPLPLRCFVELEALDQVPFPAPDGSPLGREESRWARFQVPLDDETETLAPRPETEPADPRLRGVEEMDTRYFHMTNWQYQ